MSKTRALTPYQTEILDFIHAAHLKGEMLDLDQLLEILSWHPTKQSLQFTVRALITKGCIAKTDCIVRRARKRVCFILTPVGLAVYDPRGPIPSGVIDDLEVPTISDDLVSVPSIEEVVLDPGQGESIEP